MCNNGPVQVWELKETLRRTKAWVKHFRLKLYPFITDHIRRTSRAVKLKLDFVNVCTLYSLTYNYVAMDTHIIGVGTN